MNNHVTTIKHADADRPAVIIKTDADKGCGPAARMVTTLRSAHWIGAGFGGAVLEGLAITRAEEAALRKFYGFVESADHPIIRSGDLRSIHRHAARDAMRLMTYLAKHLEGGEDPVKLLVRWHRCAAEQGEAAPVETDDLGWSEDTGQ